MSKGDIITRNSLMFANVPRLGHTNDITTTFSGEFDDIEPYVRGLTFIPILLLSFTLLCLLLILIFKCCPVGFLSGKRFSANSRLATPIRIMFGLCSILWIISIFLTVTEGIQNVHNTLGVVWQTNTDIARLGGEGIEITQSLSEISYNSSIIRNELVEDLTIDKFCPNTDINQVTGIDFSSLRNTAIDGLTTLSDFLSDNKVDQILEGLNDLEEGSDRIDKELERVNDQYDWVSLMFLVPWIMVPSFMLVGVILSSFRIKIPSALECLQQWLFLPLLFLMTIFSAAVASITSVLAIANADFCAASSTTMSTGFQYSGPRLSIILLAESLELDESVTDVGRYYLSSCQDGENPFVSIQQYIADYLPDTTESLSLLLNTISEYGAENLNILCDNSYSFLDLEVLIADMQNILWRLLDNIKNVMSLLDCHSEISPLISRVLDEGVCDYSLNSLAWVVIGFSVMTLLGFFMILFRSSYLSSEEIDGDEDCDAIYRSTPQSSMASSNYYAANPNYDDYDYSSSDSEIPSKVGTTPDFTGETLPPKPLTPEDNDVALPKPLTPAENGLVDYDEHNRVNM